MPQNLDLSTIFGEITKTLVANQQALNEADKTNHNHGDNMVKTFQTARKAVVSGKDKAPAQQLEYAAARLRKTATSGSGQIYAQGFERAAKKFEGKSVTPDTIGTLIEALMGSDQPNQTQQQSLSSQGGGGDLLTTLLGSLVGGQTAQQPQRQQSSQGEGDVLTDLLGGLMGGGQQTQQRRPESQQSQGSGDVLTDLLGGLMGGGQQTQQSQPQQGQSSGDVLTDLLGGLMGGGQQTQQNQPQQSQPTPEDLIGSVLGGLSGGSRSQTKGGINPGDLLSSALRYYAAKKSGRSSLEAIMSALSKSSPLGSSPERTQSGALVIDTLMKMLGNAR